MRTTVGAYEIWCEAPVYEEDQETRLVAAFRFMPEALDFVDYATSKGVDVVLRKPQYDPSVVHSSIYTGQAARNNRDAIARIA